MSNKNVENGKKSMYTALDGMGFVDLYKEDVVRSTIAASSTIAEAVEILIRKGEEMRTTRSASAKRNEERVIRRRSNDVGNGKSRARSSKKRKIVIVDSSSSGGDDSGSTTCNSDSDFDLSHEERSAAPSPSKTTAIDKTRKKSSSKTSSSSLSSIFRHIRQRGRREPPNAVASKGTSTERSATARRRRRIDSATSLLWSDVYAPTRVEDVAVHKKKVQDVRQWMEFAKSAQIRRAKGGGSVLVLHGPTGCAKSTLVRLLAKELDVRLREIDRGAVGFEDARSRDFCGTGFSEDIRRRRYRNSTVSELHGIAKLLRRGVRYRALSLQSSSSSIGRGKRDESSNCRDDSRAEIVLIDPMPLLKDSDEQRRLSQLLESFVSHRVDTAQSFAIVVATEHTKPSTDGRRRADRSAWTSGASVQYVLSSSVLDSPRVTCIRMNSIAKTAMRRALRRVVDLDRGGVSQSLADQVVNTADGDLRHALHTLQWSATASPPPSSSSSFFEPRKTKKRKTKTTASKRTANRRAKNAIGGGLAQCGKREFLVPFHAVGKILYAKREKPDDDHGASETSSRLPLAFDPEGVVERSGLDASRCLDFVHHNCPEFFTQVEDLAATVSHFCDADLLLATGAKYPTRCDGAFPTKYAGSLASRALAKENLSPAPRAFRKIVGPRSGGVWIAMRENRRIGQKLLTSYATTLDEGTILPGSTSLFAGFADVLPTLKTLSISRGDEASRLFRSIGAFTGPLRTIEVGSRRPTDGVVVGSWEMPSSRRFDARGSAETAIRALGAGRFAALSPRKDDGTESDPIED